MSYKAKCEKTDSYVVYKTYHDLILSKFFDKFKYLICSKVIKKLPKNLIDLTIYNSKGHYITFLPELPRTLKYLSCGKCSLEKLPELPEGLESL